MDRKKDKIIILLKQFKDKISDEFKIKKMIFFGSRSKGRGRETSDIDIILISEDFKDKKSFERSPHFYYMWDHPYDIDIICLTPEELNKKKKQIGIIGQALKEGIVIK
ncbi:MAG: nucleotidyltransferase domain-containing protein [archaeon]